MSAWLVVGLVGAVTWLFKAAGPVALGRRSLPPRVQSVVELLAPAMLAALVVHQTFSAGERIVLDARVAGVAAAGVAVALWERVPIVAAMALAAAVTALVRLAG